MLEIAIGIIVALAAAVIAIFLILIVANIALVLKLRSIIPQPTRGYRPRATARPAAKNVGE
jgi:hypothetical protein